MGMLKKMAAALKRTPCSLRQYYDGRRFDLELKAIWFGFTAALGIWFLAASVGLLWLFYRGGGTYSYGIYIYLQGILGVFLGALLAGARVQARGWFHGLWVGLFLGMMGIILYLEIMPQVVSWEGIGRQLLVWALWGVCGGHVGYCLKGNRGRKRLQHSYRSLDKQHLNR